MEQINGNKKSLGLKVGIMGGSFDPIHNGHINLAHTVAGFCGLDSILFIPAGVPPHKANLKMTAGHHRLKMVQLAIAPYPDFIVSDIEVVNSGKSYTVRTVTELKSRLQKNTQLFFIAGADMILDLKNWYRFEQLTTLCGFIAADRPGYKDEALKREIECLRCHYSIEILFAPVSPMDISSTAIRQNIKENKSIKQWVPKEVENYIKTYGLYGGTR